jgi:hypothetical protein
MRKNLEIAVLIIIIAIITGIFMYVQSYKEKYIVRGTCMEKFTGGTATTSYKVIIKYENNEVEVLDITPSIYITYKVDSTYTFEKERYNWSK